MLGVMASSTSPTPPIRRHLFRTLEAKSLRSRSWSTRIADQMTIWCSRPSFLYLNIAVFVGWIIVNTGLIPAIPVFDPYPFGFLTMSVSLEAIVLSIFVLVSQNRAAQIATLREEMHLRINLIAEREITKTLELLAEMRQHMGIKKRDPELDQMLEEINMLNIEHSIEQQLDRANKPVFALLSKKELAGLFKSILSTSSR